MRPITTLMSEVDNICDYIPVISTVSNLVNLFEKCAVVPCISKESRTHYWSHIKFKEIARCLFLLIPVISNIYYFVTDYLDYEKDKETYIDAQNSIDSSIKLLASSLAQAAYTHSGKAVSTEEMMPAQSEDQQIMWSLCSGDNIDKVKQFLDKGLTPNFFHVGNTPLVTAASNQNSAIMSLLIERGADVNMRSKYGLSALDMACINGDIEKAKILLPHINNINEANAKGMTPLVYAVNQNNPELIRFLIEKGADPTLKAVDGSDALYAAIYKDNAEIIPLLYRPDQTYSYKLKLGLFYPDIENLNPLLLASLFNKENAVKFFLDKHNLMDVDSLGNTSLIYAANNSRILEAILAKNSTLQFVEHQNRRGQSALHKAIENGNIECAKILLKYGHNLLTPDSNNKTPFQIACAKSLKELRESFIATGQLTPEMIIEMDTAFARNFVTPLESQAQSQASIEFTAFKLWQTSLEAMSSLVESRLDSLKRDKMIGPRPRSGMEILFGKI